jgi:Glycosyltransferase family 87
MHVRSVHAVPIVRMLLERGGLALWALLTLGSLLNVGSLIRALPGNATGRDFRQLYAAGYMVRTGLADKLYDVTWQRSVQHTLFRQYSGGDIYFIRPAYEALVFLPLSFLSYRWAYLTLLMVNVGLIYVLVVILSPFSLFSRIQIAIMILAFVPVSVALFQGQDSILLTVMVAASCRLLDGRRPVLAGILAGSGLFKFQLLIPVFLLFLAWKRWRFALGFALSALGLSFLSVAITGFHQSWQYLRLVANVSDQQNLTSYMMPNLRGAIDVITGNKSGALVIGVHLIVACLIALIFSKPPKDRYALPVAIPAALLCSYYLLIHDWSLLFLPIVVVLVSKQSTNAAFASGLLLLLLPAVLPGTYFYLLTVPLIITVIVLKTGEKAWIEGAFPYSGT